MSDAPNFIKTGAVGGNRMRKISRRQFARGCLALGAAALGIGRNVFARLSEPDLKFPAEPRERLAVASWPFRALIESPTNRWARDPKQPGMDLKEFAAMVIEKFGLRKIEPLSEHFGSTDSAYLGEFRETLEKSGARVVNIAVGGDASFYDPDSSRRRKAVEYAKKWVEIAVALGSPSIRAHIARAPNAKPDVARAAESLAQLAAYGAEKNVIINLENDDLVSEDALFIVEVIEKVANSYLRALPDFCNSMLSGNAQFNDDAVRVMFRHAYNIAHMKDSEVAGRGKVFTVDVEKTFQIAKASGYRGYFSMEWEGQGEPFAGTQRLIDLSLKYMA